MNSQIKLRVLITKTEFLIREKRQEVALHSCYFTQLKRDNKWILLSLIVPSAWLGWQWGRRTEISHHLSRFAKHGLLTAATNARKQFFQV